MSTDPSVQAIADDYRFDLSRFDESTRRSLTHDHETFEFICILDLLRREAPIHYGKLKELFHELERVQNLPARKRRALLARCRRASPTLGQHLDTLFASTTPPPRQWTAIGAPAGHVATLVRRKVTCSCGWEHALKPRENARTSHARHVSRWGWAT